MTFLLQIYDKRKGWPLINLGINDYLASKLLRYPLRYMQPQAYSLCIKLLGRIKEPKKFKQLILVFFFNTNPRVLHGDLNHSVTIRLVVILMVLLMGQIWFMSDICHHYFDESSRESKLQSVRKQV